MKIKKVYVDVFNCISEGEQMPGFYRFESQNELKS